MMSKLKTNQGCIRSNDLKADSLESKNITVWLGKEKKVRNQFVVWVKQIYACICFFIYIIDYIIENEQSNIKFCLKVL